MQFCVSLHYKVVSDLLCAKHYQTVTFTNTDNLVFMEHFHSLCSEMVTSSEDKELLLLELTRRGAIATGVTSKEMKVRLIQHLDGRHHFIRLIS